MTVYIDSLFMMNLMMDSVLLFAVQIFTKRCVSVLKILIGAALLSLYGSFIFLEDISFLYGAVQKAVISSLAVVLIFGRNKAYRTLAVFWTAVFVLGGGMYALLIMTDFSRYTDAALSGASVYININPFISGAGAAVMYLLLEMHRRGMVRSFSRSRILIDTEVRYRGRNYKMKCLVDTGCCVTDAVHGRGVIIAHADIFKGIPPVPDEIYVHTAAGGSIMKIIFPDEVRGETETLKIIGNTPVVLCDRKLNADGLYNAIINPDATEDAVTKKTILKERAKISEWV